LQERTMSRICPITVGSLLVGLAGVSTWLLCSAEVLNEASFFFVH
jgi:hypothetical protein